MKHQLKLLALAGVVLSGNMGDIKASSYHACRGCFQRFADRYNESYVKEYYSYVYDYQARKRELNSGPEAAATMVFGTLLSPVLPITAGIAKIKNRAAQNFYNTMADFYSGEPEREASAAKTLFRWTEGKSRLRRVDKTKLSKFSKVLLEKAKAGSLLCGDVVDEETTLSEEGHRAIYPYETLSDFMKEMSEQGREDEITELFYNERLNFTGAMPCPDNYDSGRMGNLIFDVLNGT